MELGGAEVNPLMRRDHHHLQMLNLRVKLHLRMKHRKYCDTGFVESRGLQEPEHTIQAVVNSETH